MNVYFDLLPVRLRKDIGLSRVVEQLEKYRPKSVTRATDPDKADLVVMHVIGRRDHVRHKGQIIRASGRKYAVIQYVLRSSRNPHPYEWEDVWNGAKVVWSYYDVRKDCPNLYLAPLGADPKVFFGNAAKKFLVCTVGRGYKEECIGEMRMAARLIGGKTAHVGVSPAADPDATNFAGEDSVVRSAYNQSHYVSALRHWDGFELPAVEGLLCGARPIVFDTPHYRQWYDGLAEFIPERGPVEVVKSLTRLFAQAPRPVTDAETAEAKMRFDWQKICEGFWQRCLN